MENMVCHTDILGVSCLIALGNSKFAVTYFDILPQALLFFLNDIKMVCHSHWFLSRTLFVKEQNSLYSGLDLDYKAHIKVGGVLDYFP